MLKMVKLLLRESFAPIDVDLEQQSFAIEGIAVGIIRNGSWM